MILEKDVKKTSVDVVFVRTALDPRTLRNISAHFFKTVSFEIWKDKQFQETLSFTKILGHGIGKTRVIKVFLNKKIDDRTVSYEVDFHTASLGYTITETTEKRLTKKKAQELIESLKVRCFDNEQLALSELPH